MAGLGVGLEVGWVRVGGLGALEVGWMGWC